MIGILGIDCQQKLASMCKSHPSGSVHVDIYSMITQYSDIPGSKLTRDTDLPVPS